MVCTTFTQGPKEKLVDLHEMAFTFERVEGQRLFFTFVKNLLDLWQKMKRILGQFFRIAISSMTRTFNRRSLQIFSAILGQCIKNQIKKIISFLIVQKTLILIFEKEFPLNPPI